MGAWSDYPDGNDTVADQLAIFLQRYFMMILDDTEFENLLNELRPVAASVGYKMI